MSKGDPQICALNTAKMGAPFRADVRLNVARIITDCEVDDESRQPFKDMRYPLGKIIFFVKSIFWNTYFCIYKNFFQKMELSINN